MCSGGSGDALADLERALDRVAAEEDLKGMFGPQVLDRTRALTTLKNRLDAELIRTVREGELTPASEHDGAKTMQAWLRGHARYSESAAHRVVVCGRALEHLPALAAAFTAGRVTAEAVAVVAPVAREEHRAAAEEAGVDLAAVDELLAELAATRPVKELSQVVHHYLANLDPDGKEPDPTDDRRFTMTQQADGAWSGRFELDAVGGGKVAMVLESMLQANRSQGDMRNRSQQQADAFVQWADNTLSAGQVPVLRGVRPQVGVTIDLDDLVDPRTGHGAARAGFGGSISAARARWLACDGGIARIVFGPDGQPVDLGREKRLVPPHIRRGLDARDKECVFAGCHAPTWWCDAHHVVHWLDGGETSVENSALLCERHHTKVHHGFRIERQPDGRWHTYRPDGTEILMPEPLRAA